MCDPEVVEIGSMVMPGLILPGRTVVTLDATASKKHWGVRLAVAFDVVDARKKFEVGGTRRCDRLLCFWLTKL